jgi:DNA polymerase III delta prime subunit
MSKSYIISSIDDNFIKHKIAVLSEELEVNFNSADYLQVTPEDEKESIGIEKTRALKKWMTIKPYNGKNKIAVIYNAHMLTVEAQNSILKELEEPNPGCFTILSTNNHNLLLPTVLSRCELIQDLSNYNDISGENLLELSKIEQFKYIESILTIKHKIVRNERIKKFIKDLLYELEKELLSDKNNFNIRRNIELAELTYKMITSNSSKRLALENLIINLN